MHATNADPGNTQATQETFMEIEFWPVDRPRPYGNNPRVISDKAVEKVAASIRQFGWRQPIGNLAIRAHLPRLNPVMTLPRSGRLGGCEPPQGWPDRGVSGC